MTQKKNIDDHYKSRTTHDLVSIIMPAYNGETFIKEAIDSVLCQNYKNIELIIVNDASTDTTATIVKEYLKLDSRVKYFYNRTNKGIAITSNKAIKKSSGRYIHFLDQDDLLMPNCIESLLSLFKQSPDDVKLIYGDIYLYYGKHKKKTINRLAPPIKKPSLFLQFLKNNPIVPCGCMVESEALRSVGMFDTNYKLDHDYNLWHRLIKKYNIRKINKAIAYYRIHEKQNSKDTKTLQIYKNKVLKEYVDGLNLDEFNPSEIDNTVLVLLQKKQKPFELVLKLLRFNQNRSFSDQRKRIIEKVTLLYDN